MSKELPQEIIAYNSEPRDSAVDLWCSTCAMYIMRWAYVTPSETKRMADIHVTSRIHKESLISNQHAVPPIIKLQE